MNIYLILNAISFMISTLIDVFIIGIMFFLFYKIYKTRIITTENNIELHKYTEEVDEIKAEIKHHE